MAEEARIALKAYVEHYTQIVNDSPAMLNQKLPRKIFEKVLNEVGVLLNLKAVELAETDERMIAFLRRNPVPPCLGSELTPEIRSFALLLNALSQWCTAEKLAFDRFLFSGDVRKQLKKLALTCPVSPDDFEVGKIELHHPVRDGRPPLPLSKKGHEKIEGLIEPEENDEDGKKLFAHHKTSTRRYSWRSLRLGCLSELGREAYDKSVSRHRTARGNVSFVKRGTGISVESLLSILDRYELGLLEEDE